MKILYIEDNQDIGELTYMLLTENSHEVLWVQNRQDIPQVLSQFELVVSDYNVPGGTFEETVTNCERAGIPLLLVSGNHLAHYKNSCPKPYSPDKLIQSIERLVKSAG